MSKTLKAFAVVGDGYGDSPDQLQVAATDGSQLAVFASKPDAFGAVQCHGEEVLSVTILGTSEHEGLIARYEQLQQRLTAADERADLLVGLLQMIRENWNEPDPGPEAYACRDAIEAALKPAEGGGDSNTCTWSHDQDWIYNASCGATWTFHEDGPTENGMRSCHSCGKTLVVDDGTETANRSDSASAKRTETSRLASS